MFENYVVAKTSKAKKWAMITIGVSLVAHFIVVMALVIRGYWQVERHDPPKESALKISVLAKAPPPPPPKKGVRKKKRTQTKKIVTKKMKIVKATDVQPTPKTKIVTTPDTADDSDLPEGDPDGVEGGVTGGVPGGVVGGVLGSSGTGAPPPPPPPPSPPKIVLQHVLEQRRISGEKRIVPSESDKLKIRRDDKSQVIASMKMCLNGSGTVARVTTMKSSGYPGYDAKIRGKMRQWRYKPFMVNGKAVPVCTSVTFIYRQTN